MTRSNRVVQWGGRRLTRRLRRSIPWVGTAIALATIVSTVRRKGVVSGVFDTGLDALPLIGTAKNVVELARGKDFFPDRPVRSTLPRRTGSG